MKTLTMWLGALGLGMIVAVACAWLVTGVVSWAALSASWAVTLANAFTARTLNARALRGAGGGYGFLLWGAVGNGLRIIVLVAILFVLARVFRSEVVALFIGAAATYVPLLVVELVELRRQSLSGTVPCGATQGGTAGDEQGT